MTHCKSSASFLSNVCLICYLCFFCCMSVDTWTHGDYIHEGGGEKMQNGAHYIVSFRVTGAVVSLWNRQNRNKVA